MLPVLYSFRRCPYAIRARLAILAAGIAVDLREVDLRKKPPELLALSPKGTVPVLALEDGRVIDESLQIMNWALQTSDPLGWLPDASQSAATALTIAHNDGPFKDGLDRYKYSPRYPGRSQTEYRCDLLPWLDALEARLVVAAYLTGPRAGLVDVALLPFIRQFAAVDRRWFDGSPYPRLGAWLNGWTSSELFLLAMKK